jgi:hypothetical protein
MKLFPSKRHTLSTLAVADQVTMRRAYPDDFAALAQLAALDCGRVPTGDVLVAEVDGELWAAVAVGSDSAIADPFRASAAIVRLLRMRAAQLDVATRAADREPSRLRSLAPRRLRSPAPRRQPTG